MGHLARRITGALICTILTLVIGVFVWRAVATQHAIHVLSDEISKSGGFEAALGPLPRVATTAGVSTWLGIEQLDDAAAEKVTYFLALHPTYTCRPDIALLVREGDIGRRYFSFSVKPVQGTCAIVPDKTVQITRDRFISEVVIQETTVLKPRRVLGWPFVFGFGMWTNKTGDLVRLDGQVARLPTFFWERWKRQFEGAHPPYWVTQPVFKRHVPLGISLLKDTAN